MKRLTYVAACLYALMLAGPTSAQSPDSYQIKTEIRTDGQLIGSPTIRVRSGQHATVGSQGADGYTFTAGAQPVPNAPDEQAIVVAELSLNATPDAEPQKMNMVVRLDEPAMLEFRLPSGTITVAMTVAR